MVKPRSKAELELMRQCGKISAKALKRALERSIVGVNLLEIEKVAWETIIDEGGEISFTTVDDYKWATCLTVNDQLVHGIPHDYVLKLGDKLSIDVGAVWKGWHTDTAWSVIIEGGRVQRSTGSPQGKGESEDIIKKKKFLAVGEEALWKGVREAVAGKFIGDISNAIQTTIEGAGFSVSKELIGHGVGREVHEPPDVPGIGQPGMGLLLQEGMTIAIEAIYAEKDAKVFLEKDGWTYTTVDGSLAGLFEMSVIVRKDKAEVLTDWRKV
jgi:methionyl aminopeptidase